MTNLVGQYLERYHILEQIGEGGMAIVYKAYDTRLERHVAIKVIRTEQFAPAVLKRILRRFEREAKSLARLSHPNIVKVYDYGEYEGSPYLVMEYLPKGTLKSLLQERCQLSYIEALQLLLPIACALEYAHGEGIVHRDVKPSNILITRSGELMLADFGVAKILEGEETALTRSGAGVGTPEYMAPEQWRGEALPQSDQYALGVILYEMVTGRKPYTATTPMAIAIKQATEPLLKPSQIMTDLPDEAEDLIIKALAKDWRDRYAGMDEMVGAMKKLIGAAINVSQSSGEKRASELEDTVIKKAKANNGMKAEERVVLSNKIPAEHPNLQLTQRWIWVTAVIVLIIAAWGVIWQQRKDMEPQMRVAQGLTQEISWQQRKDIEQKDEIIATERFSATATVQERRISAANAAQVQLLRTLERQKDKVMSIAYSADGSVLASGSDNGTVRLWRAADGKLLRRLWGHTDRVNSIAYSADGLTIATGSGDRTVRLWRAADGELLRTLWGHTSYVTSVTFSPDSSILASGSGDNTVRLWGVKDGMLLHTLEGHTDGILSVSYSADGSVIASGSGDNTVRLWQAADGELLRILEGHTYGVYSVAFSPDDKLLASGAGDRTVRLWRAADGELLRALEGHTNWISSISFSPDGTVLASGSADGSVRLWRAADGELLRTLEGDAGMMMSVAFSPDGEVLASGSDGGAIQLWGVQ